MEAENIIADGTVETSQGSSHSAVSTATLLGMPREVRNQIIDYVLFSAMLHLGLETLEQPADRVVSKQPSKKTGCASPPPLQIFELYNAYGLFLTNWQLHQETTDQLNRKKTTDYEVEYLARLGSEVKPPVGVNLDHSVCDYDSNMRSLLRNVRPTRTLIPLQASREIDTLNITLVMLPYNGRGVLRHGSLADTINSFPNRLSFIITHVLDMCSAKRDGILAKRLHVNIKAATSPYVRILNTGLFDSRPVARMKLRKLDIDRSKGSLLADLNWFPDYEETHYGNMAQVVESRRTVQKIVLSLDGEFCYSIPDCHHHKTQVQSSGTFDLEDELCDNLCGGLLEKYLDERDGMDHQTIILNWWQMRST